MKTTFVNAASLKTSGVGYYKKGDLRHPVVVDIDRDSKQVFFRGFIEPPPPPVKKQDMTLQQLSVYDGLTEECEGRICLAVNGKIFDVTKGKRFYGPGGPYSGFAGRDASRGLATFSVEPVSDDYDDLSDLKPGEMEQVQEWELQFR